MPRLRSVPRSEAADDIVLRSYQRLFGDRDPVSEPGTATGTPGDCWTVFALVPDVLKHAVRGFALYASPRRLLPPQLRELAQTRAGWAVGSQFVFSQHCKGLPWLRPGFDALAAALPRVTPHEFPRLDHGGSGDPSKTNPHGQPEIVAAEIGSFFAQA